MAPRIRGISRRGTHSGSRGQSTRSPPEFAEPSQAVAPSPRPLHLTIPIPMGNQQSSRFVFQSSLDKPVITVNFTISVSEEAIRSPTPASPPRIIQGDSEILLGDLTGVVFPIDPMQEDFQPTILQAPAPITQSDPVTPLQQAPVSLTQPVPEANNPQPPEGSSRRAEDRVPKAKATSSSTRTFTGNMHIVTHPDGSPVFDNEGMVMWIPSTSSDSENASDRSDHAG